MGCGGSTRSQNDDDDPDEVVLHSISFGPRVVEHPASGSTSPRQATAQRTPLALAAAVETTDPRLSASGLSSRVLSSSQGSFASRPSGSRSLTLRLDSSLPAPASRQSPGSASFRLEPSRPQPTDQGVGIRDVLLFARTGNREERRRLMNDRLVGLYRDVDSYPTGNCGRPLSPSFQSSSGAGVGPTTASVETPVATPIVLLSETSDSVDGDEVSGGIKEARVANICSAARILGHLPDDSININGNSRSRDDASTVAPPSVAETQCGV